MLIKRLFASVLSEDNGSSVSTSCDNLAHINYY